MRKINVLIEFFEECNYNFITGNCKNRMTNSWETIFKLSYISAAFSGKHICNNVRSVYNINMSLSGSRNGVCMAGTIRDCNCTNGSLILGCLNRPSQTAHNDSEDC